MRSFCRVNDTDPNAERFFALIQKELGAQVVRLLPAGSSPPEASNIVACQLGDGRTVLVVFDEAPTEAAEVAVRLHELTMAFEHSPRALHAHAARISVPRSLKDELRALATRSMAVDALVIDADSPVVWGSAYGQATTPAPLEYSTAYLVEGEAEHDWATAETEAATHLPSEPPAAEAGQEDDDDARATLVMAALSHVRGLAALEGLAKGKPFVHHHVDDEVGVAAHSFASIYLLLLVYPGSFDELRAERAITEALPRIEELVSALPPLDPEPAPMAGVVRMPRRRR